MKKAEKLPAIIVGHPMGAVKEQSSDLPTPKLAEKGLYLGYRPFRTGPERVAP